MLAEKAAHAAPMAVSRVFTAALIQTASNFLFAFFASLNFFFMASTRMDPFFLEELELLALDTELLEELELLTLETELFEELLEEEPSSSANAGSAEVMAIVAVMAAARSFPYFIHRGEKEIE